MTDNAQGDLSPMLSHPHDDNAPMVSGRGTNIIADARGAYLVRDLRGLLWRMDEHQSLRFRAAFVHQAVVYAGQQITFTPNSDEHRSLDLVNQWLEHPAHPKWLESVDFGSIEEQLMSFATRFRFHQASSQQAYYALRVIHAVTIRTIVLAAWQPVFIAPPNLTRTHQQMAHRWQIETAWAILQGKQPPSLPVD